MKGYATTFVGLFDEPGDSRPAVDRIEIPIIQRDYAQGREDDATATIRRDFLDVLLRALTTTESVRLDFIYGEVVDGVLKPLDGQQRLTTLFLLHWYVASRAGALDPTSPWTRFQYSTRLSAEYFCRELVTQAWPQDGSDPVEWIKDQPWYLFPWRTDPTIQSMLVMIRAIHERLGDGDRDFAVLWERLISADAEAISFLFLPIDDMASGEDLYIKMNSRGRPLTEFEVFKARLEKLLEPSGKHELLSEKIDRQWSDLLWHYEGGNFLVDEEFMNYLAFIIDVCEWRTGSPRTEDPLLERAERLFVTGRSAQEQLEFLFFAFDTWTTDVASENLPAAVLPELFSVGGDSGSGLLLFESENQNLFAACLEHYGSRRFTLAETLFLYAVIIHRQQRAAESNDLLKTRLRALRNLAESAPDDVRAEYMPELIASTTTLMTAPMDAYLDGLKRFNQARVDDEKRKRDLASRHPEVVPALHALEDHELLRGRLFAFDLDPGNLAERGDTFREVTTNDVLPRLGAALLAKGDYSRRLGQRTQLGVAGQRGGSGPWRDILTGGSRDGRRSLRDALGLLLEDVASRQGGALAALDEIIDEWLAERAGSMLFDWRYYFVHYPVMLSAPQGIYVGHTGATETGLGYEVDMLNGRDYRSAFTDPYLLAIWDEVSQQDRLTKPQFRSWDYTGAEKAMRLVASGTGVRNVRAGFEILLPESTAHADVVSSALAAVGIDDQGVVRVTKHERGGHQVDAQDRIRLGVTLVESLLDGGL